MKLIRAILAIGLACSAGAPSASPQPLPQPGLYPPTVHPNLLVDISEKSIKAVMETPVKESRPVKDYVRGSDVCGHSWSQGFMNVDLAPDPCKAALDITVTGKAYSKTLSLHDPVKIYSGTYVTFEIRKRLFIDTSGMSGLFPLSKARACNELYRLTDFDDDADSLLAKAAKDAYLADLDETNRFSSRHAEKRQAIDFEKDFAPHLQKASGAILDAQAAIRQQGFKLDRLLFCTSDRQLGVRAWFATPGQSAKTPKPPAPDPAADLTVRLHQSLVNEAARLALAGRTYSLEDALKLAVNLFAQVAPDSKSPINPKVLEQLLPQLLKLYGIEPVTISFAAREPIRVDFGDGGFDLTVRADRVISGNTAFPGTTITIGYRFEKAAGGMVLVRKGPAKIGDEKEEGVRKRLEAIFNAAILERIPVPAIPLMGKAAAAGPLLLTRAEVQEGWLLLDWRK